MQENPIHLFFQNISLGLKIGRKSGDCQHRVILIFLVNMMMFQVLHITDRNLLVQFITMGILFLQMNILIFLLSRSRRFQKSSESIEGLLQQQDYIQKVEIKMIFLYCSVLVEIREIVEILHPKNYVFVLQYDIPNHMKGQFKFAQS